MIFSPTSESILEFAFERILRQFGQRPPVNLHHMVPRRGRYCLQNSIVEMENRNIREMVNGNGNGAIFGASTDISRFDLT